jgi:hypothetical protein
VVAPNQAPHLTRSADLVFSAHRVSRQAVGIPGRAGELGRSTDDLQVTEHRDGQVSCHPGRRGTGRAGTTGLRREGCLPQADPRPHPALGRCSTWRGFLRRGHRRGHEHQLSPTLFYLWQTPFFENGPAAFERKNAAPEGHLHQTIAALRDKLQRKNEVVAELMEEHIKLKKTLGSSERTLGSPRYPRLLHRLRPALVRTHRDPRATIHRLARHRCQQVPRREDTLRISPRAQCPGPSRRVARTVGESGHPRLPCGPSPGGLQAACLHDDRCRYRRRQPLERLSRAARRGIDQIS